MKYLVKFACGCEKEVQLFGKETDRQREIEKMQSRLCPDCYKAKQLEAAKEANAGLPALEGSEKQVAWAEKIRARFVAEFEEKEAANEKMYQTAKDATPENIAKHKRLFAAFKAEVLSEAKASKWIDLNDKSASIFVNSEFKNYVKEHMNDPEPEAKEEVKKVYFVETNGYNMLISDDGEVRRVLIENDNCNLYAVKEAAEEFLRDYVEDDSGWTEYENSIEELTEGCNILAVVEKAI